MPLNRRGGRPGLLGMAARTAVVAGTATAVSGRVQSRQNARAQQQYDAQQYEAQQAAEQAPPPPPEPAAAPAAAPDLMSQLQQLATLHTQGILDDAEFSAAKAKLLA